MKRRDFFAATAGAIAGMTAGVAFAQRSSTQKLGNIGLQLYTLRDMMKRSVPRTLEEVAKAGYEEVEFAGNFNRTSQQIRQMLDANGLKSPSAHIQMSDLGPTWQVMLEDANIIGQKYLTLAWIDVSERTLDGYKRVADRLNEAGIKAAGEGVQLAFHNHAYGFDEIAGQIPYEILLRETDPRYLVMEADVFWMRQAKQDPLSWFARYPGRFHMLHLKDMGPPPEDRMLDVGKGVIDWRTLLTRSKAAGVRHYFVEHDEPRDPIASIRSSYRYLRGLTFPA
jgi:sugar phosphate isomerase/epimerase